jgi:hypothetical protein
MRINRHDAKLDALLGRAVRIDFTDGDVREGVLGWQERTNLIRGVQSQYYYLMLSDGTYLSFRKAHVKDVSAI